MRHHGFFFFPLTFSFFLTLVLFALFVFMLIEINVIRYAYERIGIHQRYIFLVLLLSLAGGYINIPVAVGIFIVALVALVTHWMAHPLAGVGIVIPMFLPPIVAAFAAMVLSQYSTPSLAYIAGNLGTLIGADLLNLDKVCGLGARGLDRRSWNM